MQRTRVVKAKAHLNTFLLTSIKLNDRIILSNKRYLINTMTTDLVSGEVNLELINDFSKMLNHILQMLKIAEQYENTETIAIAKGRYEYPKTYLQLFKKALQWR
jgi:hypothetical protein